MIDPFADRDDFRAEVAATLGILAQGIHWESVDLSFDVILPYLFSAIPGGSKAHISLLLGAYRALICDYIDGRGDTEYLVKTLRSSGIEPVRKKFYERLNTFQRASLRGNLFESYLRTTRRVFYRKKVLQVHAHLIGVGALPQLLRDVDSLSAFLLFDDDVMDLEEDLAAGKHTLLSEYLMTGRGTVYDAAKEMILGLRDLISCQDNVYLARFTGMIVDVYQHSLDFRWQV